MTPEDRRRTIVVLLDHWPDLHSPASSGLTTMTGDGEGGLPLLSSMASHPSVVELGRCLEQLRQTGPRHYKHLRGHFDAEWRTVPKRKQKRLSSGRVVWELDPNDRTRERVLPDWLELRLVENGIDFLAGVFKGDPELPRALHDARVKPLREFTDGDGTHLTAAA